MLSNLLQRFNETDVAHDILLSLFAVFNIWRRRCWVQFPGCQIMTWLVPTKSGLRQDILRTDEKGHGHPRLITAHGEQRLAHRRDTNTTAQCASQLVAYWAALLRTSQGWPLYNTKSTYNGHASIMGRRPAEAVWETLGSAIHVDVLLTCTSYLNIVAD